MLKKVYSVYDVKTGVYGPLMLCLTDGEALRAIEDAVNQANHPLAMHPNDYRLDCLGEYNLATGEIVQVECPRHIVDCAQLVRKHV